MSYFGFFFGDRYLITILKVLPFEKDIQELILEKLILSIIQYDFYFSIHDYEEVISPYYLDFDDYFYYH